MEKKVKDIRWQGKDLYITTDDDKLVIYKDAYLADYHDDLKATPGFKTEVPIAVRRVRLYKDVKPEDMKGAGDEFGGEDFLSCNGGDGPCFP